MATKLRVLILEDSAADAELVVRQLARDQIDCEWTRVDDEAGYLAALESGRFDLIIADYTLPRIDAPRALELLKEAELELPFVVVTGSVGEERATSLMRDGATDYLIKDRLTRLGMAVRRALAERDARLAKREADEEILRLKRQLELENAYLKEEIKTGHNFEEIVGSSPSLERALEAVDVVAHTDATVLILGETGTGKELFARAIHDRSQRSGRPLVKVNCAALSSSLIENELFGHERGSFTGATGRTVGRFELADRGTLFLDEIGELPIDVQAKLLRVLQEGEFERIGAAHTVRVDVRIIAATNRDLEREVEAGRFRADLFYRLNVFPLRIPPLRGRGDDIIELAEFFARRFARKHGKTRGTLPQEAKDALSQYHWPGNVRELENVIERAVIMATGDQLSTGEIIGSQVEAPAAGGDVMGSDSRSLAEVEAAHIRSVLSQTGWRVEGAQGAAARLGLKPGTLRSRMKKLGIARPSAPA